MTPNLFGDRTEIEKDLLLLEYVGWMRMQFSARICEESRSQDERVLATLRLEAAYQFAEFYYLLAAREIKSVEQLEALANGHNDFIIQLTKDRAKMSRLGLKADRLLDAMFTSDTFPRLRQNWVERPGAIDQSNLARLLALVMSTETCRKIVVACTAGEFLAREKTPYGNILISSRGILERIFGQCVRDTRTQLKM